jgi:hypothetical protein
MKERAKKTHRLELSEPDNVRKKQEIVSAG